MVTLCHRGRWPTGCRRVSSSLHAAALAAKECRHRRHPAATLVFVVVCPCGRNVVVVVVEVGGGGGGGGG